MGNSFDAMAQSFDTDYRIQRAQAVGDAIGKSVNIDPQHNVLEFGCGTGLVTMTLIDRIGNITLVDTSEGMLKQLRQKMKEVRSNTRIAIHNDIFSDEIKSGSFDVIYTSMVLHHINDIDSIAMRFGSLLRKGGRVCIVDLLTVGEEYHRKEPDFSGHHGFEPDWLIQLFSDAGFAKERYEVIYRDFKEIDLKKVDYSLFLLVMREA